MFYKKYFLYAKQVVHLALPPVRLPILHLRLPSVATMERVFPRKTQKKTLRSMNKDHKAPKEGNQLKEYFQEKTHTI